jgi:hypothetical protein
MKRREDIGMRASRLTRTLSPEQLAELLAITWFDLTPGRTPTMLPAGDCYDDLIRHRIIRPTVVPGWSRRKWRLMVITDLGKLTLLFRIENDLRDAGKLPPERCQMACPNCEGTGWAVPPQPEGECHQCHGTGMRPGDGTPENTERVT